MAIVPEEYHHLLEDGLKLMGIAGWCGYAIHTSITAATNRGQAAGARVTPS